MKRKVFFLNSSLSNTRTGIEEAALKRTFYFEEHLNLQTYFVTARYNSTSKSVFNRLKKEGKVHKNTIFINIYDYYQGFSMKDDYKEVFLNEKNRRLIVQQASNKKDLRYLDEKKNIKIYNKRNDENRTIFNNYFMYEKDLKKIYRREYYDTLTGDLSKVQHLEEGRVAFEIYYKKDKTPCIYKTYVKRNNKNSVKSIELLDENGVAKQVFSNEEEFISYWYQEYFEQYDEDKMYVIIDRSMLYSKAINESRLLNLKTVFLIHSSHIALGGTTSRGKINKNYHEILTKPYIADAIVLFTEKQKKHIQQRFGDLINLYVIPHSLEDLPEKVLFEKRSRKKIIYLGRFSIIKNQKSLIKIFKEVLKKHNDAELHLYGEGETKEEMRQLIRKLEIDESVFIHPFTSNPQTIYNESGIAALPSQLEGFSLFALESISHGLPLVSYDINYGPETIIEDGKSGFLVSDSNEAEFANKLITILNNKTLHKEMSEEAYNRADFFSTERISIQWKNLLFSL